MGLILSWKKRKNRQVNRGLRISAKYSKTESDRVERHCRLIQLNGPGGLPK